MWRKSKNRNAYAAQIAEALRKHQDFLTHARPLSAQYLRSLKMKVDDLEKDQDLQDKVLTVYHATMHTFTGTPAAKIIENQNGRAYVKIMQTAVAQRQQLQPQQPRQPQQPQPGQPPPDPSS